MRKILLIHILFFTTHFYAQSNTDCFSIEPGQVIEVPENAQVGDTIATIQYCSSGEWKKLEAEFFSTLALKENGQLYTWGINGEGGSWPPITAGADPNQQIIFDPYLVKDPSDNSQDFLLDDVASSIYMAFGIKSEDKSLWGWGRDQDGQLGIGENPNAIYPEYVDYRTPQLLNNSTIWKTVSAGSYHGNAIDTEGKLWGWGYGDNTYYMSGFNTIKYTPTQVGTESDWDVVSCGQLNTYLIKDDGTLWVMGKDFNGSSGLGENPTVEGIVQIGNDSDWSNVSSYYTSAIAVKNNGQLYVWGYNDSGQLGFNPDTTSKVFSPTQIPGTENINFLYADIGRKHGLASDIDGNFYGWGENLSGQLGNGEIATYEEFQLIDTGDIKVSQVSAAGRTSGFITEGGSMRMFGSNDTGQLGYGEDAITNPNTPIVVNLGEELEGATITKYNSSSIAQGVLTDDGQLWVWGDNEYGRLGLGHADRVEENYYPNRIGEESDVWIDFSHSGQNLYAVKNNKLYGAGQNDNYNMGLGLLNSQSQLSMTEIPGVDMTEINKWQSSWAGFISIKNNGELWGFGGNWKGQLAIDPGEQITNTMNTIDVNDDGLGGINNVDNISEANTLRVQGNYETGQFTTNGLGNNASFSITINENGEASVTIKDGGNSFTEDDIITIPNIELGDNRNRSLMSNGDFENGSNSWIIGVDNNTSAPTVTIEDNTYYSENVLEAGLAYSVNVSQKTEIINGNSYTLTFDAWSDRNRAIIAGIGLSSAPFDAITETINITPERTTYSVTLEANFGDSDARVLFDLGAELGLVNIDDVSLINNNVAPDLIFQVDVYGDNDGTSSIPSYQKLNNDTDWYKIYDTKETDILIVEKNDGSIWFAGGNNVGDDFELYDILEVSGYNNNGLVEIFPVGNDWNTFSSSQGTVIGIKDDGTMWGFGNNQGGRAGVGSDNFFITEITQIGSDSDWRHINLNGRTALAIKTDNTLWAWGSGWTGQLGNGTFGNSNQPVLVSGDIQWETTGGGWLFQTAEANNGTIYGWGYNRLGGLGGLGEVSSEYLDWITDVSIIDGAFTFSDLGYVIIQDSEAIDYETISNSQGRNEVYMTNSPIEITIPMTMSDGINTSEAEDVIFKIINVNETPTDIGLSEIEFNEDNSIGYQISEISVVDPDFNDSHILQIDTEFGDFEKFEITDNKLKLIESVSYHEYETLSIKIIAEDEGELSFSKEFTINVVDINDTPVAVNDELTILEDAAVSSTNVVLNDTDEDNDNLSIINLSSDENGTVTVNTDNISIDYIPEENFNGTETITYTLSDGELTSTATLTISVTAQNDAPIAVNDELTILEDAALTSTNVVLNDSDIDDDD
ncbi:Ig-like domain-containing protein, partial [Flavobacteriaceae bacterium]|nr:Ig-like domain-containing protein [Flavobacteriaceae bacterium]